MRSLERDASSRLGLWRSGDGPPVVLVHGSAGDHAVFTGVASALETRASVYAVDRPGYGASVDVHRDSLADEGRLVAGVMSRIGAPAVLFGHSHGAHVALITARLAPLVALVLYEPPSRANLPPDLGDEMRRQLTRGNTDAAVALFFRAATGMAEDTLARIRGGPMWASATAVAEALTRDVELAEKHVFEPAEYESLHVPTTLLVGEHSQDSLTSASSELAAALPNARLVTLPGQTHFALLASPHLVANEILKALPG